MTAWLRSKDWVGLSTQDLKDQIQLRKNLLPTLVGSLYPSILRDEILSLRGILEGQVPEPLQDGIEGSSRTEVSRPTRG